MKPWSIPASTGIATLAASLTVIIVWIIKQFTHVDVPTEIAAAFTGIFTVLAGHFTIDSPPPEKDLPK